jgi:hypothetical protein
MFIKQERQYQQWADENDKRNALKANVDAIQKGYDELMERNRQTIEWMKRVGLTK